MVTQNSPINASNETNILQSFSDATAGRSQQLYYLMATSDSTNFEYIASRDAGISSKESESGNNINSFDEDFDITINKPTVISGIASLDVNTEQGSGSTGDAWLKVECTIIKYDGSTETTIGTNTFEYTLSATGTHSDKLKIECDKTLLGIGDILRFNIKVSIENTARPWILYLDPLTAGQELKVWVPIVNME